METKTKKIVALFAIMGILLTNSAYAEKIGTGSITGSGTTFDINWD
jgi:hypothetical protein